MTANILYEHKGHFAADILQDRTFLVNFAISQDSTIKQHIGTLKHEVEEWFVLFI